mgnify:CR=1 FL=1
MKISMPVIVAFATDSATTIERIPRAFPLHVAHMGEVKRG